MNAHVSSSYIWTQLREMGRINRAVETVRQLMGKSVPPDFTWSFMFVSGGEFVFNWCWDGDPKLRYQRDLRGVELGELLFRVSKLDWTNERRAARQQLNFCGGIV